MEEVLVSELLYFQGAQGHIRLNEKYIKCISSHYAITLLDDGNYFSGISDSLIKERVIMKIYSVPKVEKLKAICHAINLFNIARIAKKKGIRTVILLSFHTEGFYLARRCFEGINVLVVHHYDIDRMTKRPKEIKWFNAFKDQITHCSLEDFITDGLVEEFSIPTNRVFTVNTPFDQYRKEALNLDSNLFIGIGQSTDQSLIDELIKLDKENYLDTKINGKIILRSKVVSYYGTHVEVFTGYLEQDKYEGLYNEATACIVSYEPTYKLRSSGSIDDSFKNHKKVIVMGFPAGESYKKIYPSNCILVNSAKEIMDLLIKPPQLYDEEEGARYEKVHSFTNVIEQWKKAIDSNI